MVIMQNVGKSNEGENTKDLNSLGEHGGNRSETTAIVDKSPGSPVSNFLPEMSGSDDEDVSEVESFILDPEEIEEGEQMIEASKFLLPTGNMDGTDLKTVDPETHARLEALLEAAGIGKLSTADGKALTDPEVLRKLTTSVSCALDEAAAALTRMRAEQQGQLAPNPDSSRSLAEACIDGDVGTVRRMLDEGGSVNETTEEGESLLSLACSAGYYELAQVLLKMKANVEDRGIKGDCTPLMEASSGGYVDIVRLLMTHGADVNAQSSAGNTPLHYAAAGGYEDVVIVLIESGANVEEHNENGHTPLMEAASAGHVGVARILLTAGAGINTHSNEFKESALTLACYKGHLEMVKFLLEAGADQEHKTDEMHTALMEASMDGHVEVARLLLDSGAQVNMPADSFESPLTLAACGGHVDLANLLIERGANLEEVNDEGYTPLMEAAREGHEEMVALLLAHGADINAQTEETQETALTLACCGGFLEVGDFLIKAGADIELGCSTPLMEAAQEGHLDLVKFLLKSGANVHAQTATRDTALTYASENGHTDVAEVLLSSGADLEHVSDGGRTPLMKAARSGHYSTVQFLISKGADVNRHTSNNDHTVLSLACAGGHLSVVELLLGHGANPTHKLKDGSTMIIEASKGGHTQVVNLLLEWPNGMFMAPSPDLCQVTPAEVQFNEPRVPVQGLNNIVPPSDPEPNHNFDFSIPSSSQTLLANHVKNKLLGTIDMGTDSDKTVEQILTKNIQKTLGKRSSSSRSGSTEDIPRAFRNCNIPDGSEIVNQISEEQHSTGNYTVNPDLLPQHKASEKLDAIISNMMKNTSHIPSGTREEQNQQRQQILQELQKVERELKDKAKEQVQRTAQQRNDVQKVAHLENLQVQPDYGAVSELLPQYEADLKAREKLDAIITNMMKDTTNITAGSREEQILQRPQILEEFQKVDRELKEKANEQVQYTAQQRHDMYQAQLENQASNQPIYSIHEKQLEAVGLEAEYEGREMSAENELKENEIALNRMVNPGELEQLVDLLRCEVTLPSTPPSSSTDTLNSDTTNPNQTDQSAPSLEEFKVIYSSGEHQSNMLSSSNNNSVLSPPQTQDGYYPTLENMPAPQFSNAASELFQQMHQHVISQPQTMPQLMDQQQQQHNQALILTALYKQLQQEGQIHPNQLDSDQLQQYLLSAQQQQLELKQQQLELTESLITQKQIQLHLQQNYPMIKPPLVPNTEKKPVPKPQVASAVRPPAPQVPCQIPNGPVGNMNVGELNTPPNSTPITPNPSPASPQAPLYASLDLDAQTESNHDTALTLACAGGHTELVSLLLSRSANVEHRDKKGFTPLILSATAGHVEVVEILLNLNAEIEAQSERTKDTPLSLACSSGKYEVVELLLARGAEKEHRNVSDYTPLSLAASGGYVNIIKLLLSHGAEINSRTGSKLGISPLMLAAMNGHTAAVKLLLDMGSDINAQIETNRNTALTLACFQGRHEVVSLLVDRKANIEHRAKTGLTPLMEAASGGYVEVGRVLLDKGADVNAPPVPSSRDTALTIAADKGHYRFVELLLGRGAAVDVKNKKGNSPLWLACNGGHLDVVQLLVQARADIDSQDNRKVSCLMAAFRKGHVKVVKWMVKHVNQFPSDQECSRYIQTVTDKELQKKCQQCMDIIESAKENQAAEANKNATILLEQLDMEKKTEEKRKAAAERRREKRKKKRKEKQERDKKDPDGKNSSPEPEADPEPEEEEDEMPMKEPAVVHPPPPTPLTATLTTTIGTTHRTTSAAKVSVAQVKAKVEVVYTTSTATATVTTSRSSVNTSSVPRMPKKKAKSKEKDRPPDKVSHSTNHSAVPTSSAVSEGGGSGSSALVGSTNIGTASDNKKKGGGDGNHSLSTSTGIGDLDDFGTLPPRMKISDKEVAKITKGKGKHNSSRNNDVSSNNQEKSPPSGVTLSSGKGPASIISPKRGQRKEEGWKEVIRKSKKVNVPVNAISRVIGRGGSNINAIREVSGAHIEVEKQKGTTDRVITIKGSADSTRQAHALIMALVTDPDRELVEILPKRQLKLLENSTTTTLANGNLEARVPAVHGNQTTIGSSQKSPPGGKTSNRTGALHASSNSTVNNSSSASMSHGIMGPGSAVWGGAPTPPSPKRSYAKQGSSSTPTAQVTERTAIIVSRPQVHIDKKNNSISVTSTLTNVTVSYTVAPSLNKPLLSSSGAAIRNENKALNLTSMSTQQSQGPVKVLQRPNPTTGVIKKPTPNVPPPSMMAMNGPDLMGVKNYMSSMASPTPPTSNHGQYSPFHNRFSAAAVLGKKDDQLENRMNFASVVTSNIPSPGPNTSSISEVDIDLALQAKAPGFKPTRSMSPQQFHPDMELNRSMGFKGVMPLSTQFVNEIDMSRAPGYRANIPSPGMSPRSNSSTPSGTSPRGRPATPGDPSPSAMAMSSQKDEYSTPNQPMTLPKIGSSLNPNAPDFTVRSVPPFGSPMPDGRGMIPNLVNPGQQFPNSAASSNLQQLYQMKHAMLNQNIFDRPGMGPPPTNFLPNNNNRPIPDMAPGGSSVNMMLQRLSNPGGSPGTLGVGQMMPRSFSPLQPPPGSPSSMGFVALPRGDGDNPGAPGSPMVGPPSNTDQLKASVFDQEACRQRPIGTERAQRKGPLPGHSNSAGDYHNFLGFTPGLDNEWMSNSDRVSTSVALISSTVLTSSGMTSGVMSVGHGSHPPPEVDRSLNHHPPSMTGFMDGPIEPGLQNPSMMLPPNMGRQYPPHPIYSSGNLGGDNLATMWNPSAQMKAPPSEQADKMQWSRWNNQ